MKYTNLKRQAFDFQGLYYYYKDALGTLTKSGSVVHGDIYSASHILEHVDINGFDYVEFTKGYYVKVDDLYDREPYDERVAFSYKKEELNYDIY